MKPTSRQPFSLKWDPFAQEVPVEALLATPAIEHFCRRIERTHVREGGFALIVGEPWVGKIVALRLVAERLEQIPEVSVGVMEHRATPPPDDLFLEIDTAPNHVALRICQAPPVDDPEPHRLDPHQRVVRALRGCPQPVSVRRLQEICRIRTSTLSRVLEHLVRNGTVIRRADGFTLA